MKYCSLTCQCCSKPFKITYGVEDFATIYGSILENHRVPEDAIKYLIMVDTSQGCKVPVVDINAPAEYVIGAVTHEHLCCCSITHDNELGIRSDEHRCEDAEKAVLNSFSGNCSDFIEQRKLMFQTVLGCRLNTDPTTVERMKKTLAMLENQ